MKRNSRASRSNTNSHAKNNNTSKQNDNTGTDPAASNYDASVHVDDGTCTFEVASNAADLLKGRWILRHEAAAACVGPASMSCEWWHTTAAHLDTRSCFFDDIYNFEEDGTFVNEMQDTTWLEEWQGVGTPHCGPPSAPYVVVRRSSCVRGYYMIQ